MIFWPPTYSRIEVLKLLMGLCVPAFEGMSERLGTCIIRLELALLFWSLITYMAEMKGLA